MPLMKSDMASALKDIDMPSGPGPAADAWATAWWKYAKGCTQALASSSETPAKAAFKSSFEGACKDSNSASDGDKMLEDAMKAGWKAVIWLPAYMGPPTIVSPLLLKSVLEDNAKNKLDKSAARDAIADKINTWTTMITVTDSSSGSPVPLS